MAEMTNVYKILVEKREGKRPLGRPRRRWVDNIKMDLGEMGWKMWTRFMLLRKRTSGGLLRTW
jgi:hypothetical protein